jgi:hypothetical protein
MALFRRKSLMEKLERELAALRERADTLHSRHKAAEAAFSDAEANLQRHLLEADLDGDDKVRMKLEAAVAACALTRDNFAKAITAQQAKIGEVEAKIASERATSQRHAAADGLARDLDQIEAALPGYLEAARRFVGALESIHFHYEAGEMSRFVSNTSSQVEIAAGFTLAELRTAVTAIRDGVVPIPAPKPDSVPVVAEPAPPTMTVFMLKSARYRDYDGRKRFAGQYEDATMPMPMAQRALRHGVAVSVADSRRTQLLGVRGGDYKPNAADVVDLDAIKDGSGVPYLGADPVLREAGFIEIDRSAEAHTILIEVPRL